MDIQTDPMTGAMGKGIKPTGLSNHRTSGGINFGCRYTGSYCSHSCFIRSRYNFEHAQTGGIDLADGHGSGHVRAIAIDNAPKVDHDQVAVLDASIGGPRMGLGPVRSGRNDGFETCARGSELAHGRIKSKSELGFGEAIE
jgi:hypothetical protein